MARPQRRAPEAWPFESPKNAFAPVLGGGRFMQPGADGGECLTHHNTRHQNGAADYAGAAASPYFTWNAWILETLELSTAYFSLAP
jgi:hypothetical protein